MLYGLKLCLLSLGISGCVFTGDQHGSMKLEKQKEAFQSPGNQPEVDRIGSALQESLLNLNEEVCDDSLDGVEQRLCSMSVTSSDVSACSISTTSNEETNIDEVMHVPNLWTHVVRQRQARHGIRVIVKSRNGEIPFHYFQFNQECETHSRDV